MKRYIKRILVCLILLANTSATLLAADLTIKPNFRYKKKLKNVYFFRFQEKDKVDLKSVYQIETVISSKTNMLFVRRSIALDNKQWCFVLRLSDKDPFIAAARNYKPIVVRYKTKKGVARSFTVLPANITLPKIKKSCWGELLDNVKSSFFLKEISATINNEKKEGATLGLNGLAFSLNSESGPLCFQLGLSLSGHFYSFDDMKFEGDGWGQLLWIPHLHFAAKLRVGAGGALVSGDYFKQHQFGFVDLRMNYTFSVFDIFAKALGKSIAGGSTKSSTYVEEVASVAYIWLADFVQFGAGYQYENKNNEADEKERQFLVLEARLIGASNRFAKSLAQNQTFSLRFMIGEDDTKTLIGWERRF